MTVMVVDDTYLCRHKYNSWSSECHSFTKHNMEIVAVDVISFIYKEITEQFAVVISNWNRLYKQQSVCEKSYTIIRK